MGIRLKWYDDARSVIYWRFDSGWTIEHLQAALVKNHEMLDTAPARVDVILDISGGGLLPPHLIRFIRYYRAEPHPLSHMKIIIGANEYLQLFWRNVAPLAPASWQLQFAGSLGEARTMIAQDRTRVTAYS